MTPQSATLSFFVGKVLTTAPERSRSGGGNNNENAEDEGRDGGVSTLSDSFSKDVNTTKSKQCPKTYLG